MSSAIRGGPVVNFYSTTNNYPTTNNFYYQPDSQSVPHFDEDTYAFSPASPLVHSRSSDNLAAGPMLYDLSTERDDFDGVNFALPPTFAPILDDALEWPSTADAGSSPTVPATSTAESSEATAKPAKRRRSDAAALTTEAFVTLNEVLDTWDRRPDVRTRVQTLQRAVSIIKGVMHLQPAPIKQESPTVKQEFSSKELARRARHRAVDTRRRKLERVAVARLREILGVNDNTYKLELLKLAVQALSSSRDMINSSQALQDDIDNIKSENTLGLSTIDTVLLLETTAECLEVLSNHDALAPERSPADTQLSRKKPRHAADSELSGAGRHRLVDSTRRAKVKETLLLMISGLQGIGILASDCTLKARD